MSQSARGTTQEARRRASSIAASSQSGDDAELEARASGLEAALQVLLLPKDPNDARNVMVEVRAGTGGGRG